MKTYAVTDYFDVWGNEKDGYDVNNSTHFGEIEFRHDFPTKRLILKKLKDIGFFKDFVTLRNVNIENMGEGWEISDKKGMPLCGIYPKY